MNIWYMMAVIVAITGYIVLVSAAKRRSTRRMPLQPLRFTTTLSLGTLASNTVITTPTVDSLEQDFHIVSTDLSVTLRNITAGEGPIEFGLSEQGYSVTEVNECLDASPLSQYGPEQERSRRRVRLYGAFSASEGADETINDGRPIRRKMFLRAFAHSTFAAARVWVRNSSGATLTTGASVQITGVHWGRWV